MNNFLTVILLAVIQGVTEFLPVSSSGHLALLSEFCGLKTETGLGLGIILHAGSLLAIVCFYFKTLLGFFKKEQFHLMLMVIIGSIPAGIAGLALKKSGMADYIFNDMLSVAMGFLITASVLRLTGKAKMISKSDTELKDISLRQAIIVGFAQMWAIVPGISRSGSTIAAGILSGIKFESAATFSFLLALPAIAGATLLETVELSRHGFQLGELTVCHLAVGLVVSAAVSLASLCLLVQILRRGKIAWFSWYLFLLGISLMAWQILSLSRS